jgi:S1-C subfamily serine protease
LTYIFTPEHHPRYEKILPFHHHRHTECRIGLGLFFAFGPKTVMIQPPVTKTVLANYSPFIESHAAYESAGAPDMVKAANSAKQAVVFIESLESSGNFFASHTTGGSTGSGVIISQDGYIATNHHVIADGNQINVLMEDGREFEAKVIGSDPSTDLALLKVDTKSLPYLTFGNSDSLMIGEWVLAIGNPFRCIPQLQPVS